ncbi:hypothetical protein [Streptomyces hirsutus]|nr:hypothetical protein [Streptomyces hirsutus]
MNGTFEAELEERLHSALGHAPPAECERDWRQQQEATPRSA